MRPEEARRLVAQEDAVRQRLWPYVEGESLEDRAKRQAASHDPGAAAALQEAIYDGCSVDCGSHCYGGSIETDLTEALAVLAERGFRLVAQAPDLTNPPIQAA